MEFEKITESTSPHRFIDKMSVTEMLACMNEEDQKVAAAVKACIPQIASLAEAIAAIMLKGGKLFYIGAGTSGRLGILDASECPPTFGVPPDFVTGIIAGGEKAITKAVEFAEDDPQQGWKDLQNAGMLQHDFVLGISASGDTPYVLEAMKTCRATGIQTGSISCNPNNPLSSEVDFPVEIIVGPEFITGSTRLKAGTAQKMALNMISTAVMVKLGKVQDNLMVQMQLTNEKLINRGVQIVMKKLNITDPEEAKSLLLQTGSVIKALNYQR